MKAPKGWKLIDTGGNCTAWQHAFHYVGATPEHAPDGYALLTQPGDPMAPTNDRQPVTLGIYGTADRQIVAIECASVSDAIAIVKRVSFVEENEVTGY